MALVAPVDSEGFVTSFDVADTLSISHFFDKFGFVIIHDVLSVDEVQDTIDEFHDKFNFQNNEHLESLSEEMFASVGIVGSGPDPERNLTTANTQMCTAALLQY
jgi:hypothetical protein